MAESFPLDSDHTSPGPRPMSPIRTRRWHGFPTTLPPLIGREREVAALVALCHEPARCLITLTGPGGVGKTRLALEAAKEIEAEFADGAVFVSLAAITDPALVLPAIARSLDIRDSRERPLTDALLLALRDRNLLLVLDNFEHLALPGSTAAADVAALLQACPGVTALITSRAPLRLQGEQRFLTPPLALPARNGGLPVETLASFGAIAFFVERARWVHHEFALDAENAETITEICRRLDGLPLAIELAAPWIRVLPPQALLARLDQRLPLLRGGADDQPARLQTMHDAIAWSYDLLTADEAQHFRRLAIFAGGFALEAVEWVSRDIAGPLDRLTGLVDKGLVQASPLEMQEPRFSMLETIREFALERLAESGEAPLIAAAHAASMLDLVERAEPHLMGPAERQWHIRLGHEHGNLRAALDWSLDHNVAMALRIGAALWMHWALFQIADGRRYLAAALARAATAPDSVRTKALITDGALAALEGDIARCLESTGKALTLARAAGDEEAEARVGWIVGAGHYTSGDLQAAAAALDDALPRFERASTLSSRGWAAYARSIRGAIALMLGETERGVALYEEALSQMRRVGSAGFLVIMLSDFAGWLIDLRDTDRARDKLQEALALTTRAGGVWLVGGPLISLALIDAITGDARNAALRLGALDAVRIQGGLAIPGQYQERLSRATALAHSALGEAVYMATWAAGRADPEAVIAAALGRRGADSAGAEDVAARVGLSPRQREVLALLVAGHSDKEIAAALFVARQTASKHVAAILAKLGVHSRAAAVSVALGGKADDPSASFPDRDG